MGENNVMKLCIIVLSFGDGLHKHGLSNEALAKEAEDYALRADIPVIAQWEVASNIRDPKVVRDPVCMKNGETYLNTRQVLKRAKEIMEEKRYDAAIFFAHPAHLPRVRFTAWQERIKEARQFELNIPWDKYSTQLWTRNPFLWYPRELLSFILTFFKFI
jgi:hypothetical protein